MDRSQTSSQNNLACIKAFLKERLLQKANIPEIENKIQHLISRKKCLEEEIKLKNDEAINIENKHFEPVLVCCGFFLTVR